MKMKAVEINNIAEHYSEYYYPVVLLNSDLKVVYKNKAAQAAKMKFRLGVHIKNYADKANTEIVETLKVGDSSDHIVEFNTNPSKCVARIVDDKILLMFLDSLNLIHQCSPETKQKITEITAKYNEKKLLLMSKNDTVDTAKAQKIRMYLERYIANLIMDDTQRDFSQTYCDVMDFLRNLEIGVSPTLTKMGYQISFNTGQRDNMFMYWLNENDFLTLNLILMSHALTRSIFGVLDIRFDARSGILIYEFMPAADFDEDEQEENIDLELAQLIAKNNNLKLRFHSADNSDNIIDRKAEGKARIELSFTIEPGIVSQLLETINIIDADIVAERAEIAFSELINLYNM